MFFVRDSKILCFFSGVIVGYIFGCSSSILLTLIIAVGFFWYKKNRVVVLHKRNKLVSFSSNLIDSLSSVMPRKNDEYQTLKFDIDSDVCLDIDAYCKWAKIPDLDRFVERAAGLVFSKDKDWIAYQRQTTTVKK